MPVVEKRMIVGDNLVTIIIKTVKRKELTPFTKHKIYYLGKHMNDNPPPKHGSKSNICNYYRITEDELEEILSDKRNETYNP